MIKPEEIINKRKMFLETFELHIDCLLKRHFEEFTHEYRFDLLQNSSTITESELSVLINKYRANGWVVQREKGCDDRPCGSAWDYIKFNTP